MQVETAPDPLATPMRTFGRWSVVGVTMAYMLEHHRAVGMMMARTPEHCLVAGMTMARMLEYCLVAGTMRVRMMLVRMTAPEPKWVDMMLQHLTRAHTDPCSSFDSADAGILFEVQAHMGHTCHESTLRADKRKSSTPSDTELQGPRHWPAGYRRSHLEVQVERS